MPETQVYTGKLTIEQVGVAEAVQGLEALNKVAQKIQKNLSGLKINMPKLDSASVQKQASQAGKQTKEAIEKELQSGLKVNELFDQFDRVRDKGASTVSGIGAALKRAFSQPSVDKLNQQIIQIADSADQGTRALRTQGNILQSLVTEQFGKGSTVVGEFNKQVTRVNNSIKTLSTTAKVGGDITRSLTRAQVEVEGLRREYELLRQRGVLKVGSASELTFRKLIDDAERSAVKIGEIAKRQQEVRKKTDEAAKAQDRQSKSASQLGAAFGRVRAVVAKVFDAFKRGEPAIKEANKSIEKTRAQIDKAANSANNFKTIVLGAFTGGIFASIASELLGLNNILGEIKDTVIGVGGAARNVAASLGEDAAAAERYGKIIRQVYADNFGDSIGDVGNVVEATALRLQRLGITSNEEIIRATENALRLRDAYDADVNQSIDAATTLVKGFGISYDQAFDFIAKGFQRGLDSSGDFLDSIREYTTQFASGGADAAGFFNILDTGLQGGVLGTDKAADAFKEFRVRIQDGSKLTKESLAQIGINSDELFQQMASDQVTAAEAFDFILKRLNEVDDTNIRMQAGVGLLGTQYEDLGDTALSLSLVGTTMNDLSGAAAALDLQYAGIVNTLQQIKRQFLLAFDTTIFNNLLATVGPILSQIASLVGGAINNVVGFVTSIIGPITQSIDYVLNGTGQIDGTFQNLVASFVSLINGDFASAAAFIGNAVYEALQYAGEVFVEFISSAPTYGYNYIVEVANGIYEAASSILADAMNYVGSVIASFMAPGSPPEQGPLSTIDKWGIGLMSVFAGGLGAGIAKSMDSILDPLADAIGDSNRFKEVKQNITDIFDTIAADGEVSVDRVNSALAQIDANVADKTLAKALKDQLKANVALQESNAKIAKVKEEIAAAEKEGYIPASLKAKLAAAEEENSLIADTAKAQDDLVKAQQKSTKEKSATAAAALGAAKGAAAKEVETYQQAYERELAALERKHDLGLIDEEEYVKERIKLEEKYIDSAIAAGDEIPQSRIDQLNDYKKQLEGFKDDSKKTFDGKALIGITSEDGVIGIFPDKSQVEKASAEIGKGAAEPMVDEVDRQTGSLAIRLQSRLKNMFTVPEGATLSFASIGQLLEQVWETSVRPVLDKFKNASLAWIDDAIINLPEKLTAFVNAIAEFLAGVNERIENATSPSWVDSVFVWINNAVYQISERLMALLVAFLAWANSAEAQQALTDLGFQLGQLIYEGLAQLIENQQAVQDIVGRLILGIGAAVVALTGALIVIGGQLVAGIISGMLEKIGIDVEPALFSELSGILKGIGQNLITIITTDVAGPIIDGLVNGLLGGVKPVIEAVTALIQGGIDGLKQYLGIASPSTLLATIGTDMVNGLIQGIKSMAGQVGEVVSGIFGSLFGGGADAEASSDQFATIITDSDTLQQQLSTKFNAIGTLWQTVVANMTTAFTTFLSTMVEQNTVFGEYYNNTFLATLSLNWTTFLTNVKLMWMMAITDLKQKFADFTSFVLSQLQLIIDKLRELIDVIYEVIDALEDLAEAAFGVFEEIMDGAQETADKITTILIPAIDEATSHLQALEDQAKDANAALSDISGSDRASVQGAAQSGAWRTSEGLWYLHKDEMVLKPAVAEQVRRIFGSLGNLDFSRLTSLGNMRNVSFNTSPALAGATPVSSHGMPPIQITNYISETVDADYIINRTVSEIERRIF